MKKTQFRSPAWQPLKPDDMKIWNKIDLEQKCFNLLYELTFELEVQRRSGADFNAWRKCILKRAQDVMGELE